MRFLDFSLIALALLVSGCSGSFHREWRAAAATSTPSDFTGAWEGHWESSANGHQGKLRCLVSPSDTAQGSYNFHYWAKWGWLSGDFATVYPVTSIRKDRWRFAGDSDLGALGGVYRHEGEATTETFHADFSSTGGDRGTMNMARP